MPNTGYVCGGLGVKLIYHDEENAALKVEEQHFAYPVGGSKKIMDEYLILIAKYETADVLYNHETTGLALHHEGRVNGGVVHESDAQQRTVTTAGTVCGDFERNPKMLT